MMFVGLDEVDFGAIPAIKIVFALVKRGEVSNFGIKK